MNGIIRIGGAIGAGMLLILGAFYIEPQSERTETNPKGSITATVAQAQPPLSGNTKTHTSSEDWRASLPSSTPQIGASTTPESFTDILSVALLRDYLNVTSDGEPFTEADDLVNGAIAAIRRETAAEQYTIFSITRVESTEELLRAYGNELALAILTPQKNKDPEYELDILERAIRENNPEVLSELIPIIETYAAIRDALTRMTVPSAIATDHVALLNAFSAIHSDIAGFSLAFEDPLIALAHTNEYTGSAENLKATLGTITPSLNALGITYTPGEMGYYFTLFLP